MNWTFLGFNPITQWRYLSSTASLNHPKMIFFRHLFGFDAALVLASQGFYICLLMISLLFFTFLQFVIYLAPFSFDSTSAALMICTLANFVLFFVGSHFFGRWAGQLPPTSYDHGSWLHNKLPIATVVLLGFLLGFLVVLCAGAWVLFEYILQVWTSRTQFQDNFIKGAFGGVLFLLLKFGWENVIEAICDEMIRESYKRSVKLLNHFKLIGDALIMMGYPVYLFWTKLYILDMSSEEVDIQFRYWIYGYAVIVFGARPVLGVVYFN